MEGEASLKLLLVNNNIMHVLYFLSFFKLFSRQVSLGAQMESPEEDDSDDPMVKPGFITIYMYMYTVILETVFRL